MSKGSQLFCDATGGSASKDATCGRGKETKTGQKLSCVKLAFCPDHPRRCSPLKFRIRCRVREIVIYFKFHENRLRVLGAVRGRKSPSPIDKAHGLYNSLYTTLQAVMHFVGKLSLVMAA